MRRIMKQYVWERKKASCFGALSTIHTQRVDIIM